MTRSFSFRTAGLLLLGACLSLPLSAKESAEGFSRQVALSLQGEGPWYRLSIPMSVQLSAAHADLRDLRVFDAEGEALPYTLVAGSERQASTPHEAEVRLFPLRGTSAADATQPNLRVQRNTSGTIVEVLPENAGPAAETLRGWLIDASAVTFPLERLRLDWSSPEEGFQRFSVEASDDLEHWQAWGDGQIARLTFNGERIDVSEVKLPGRQARYLRLAWPAGATAADLQGARLQGSTRSTEPAPMIWSEPLAGRQAGDGEYRWQLPLALPLQRVRVSLEQALTHTIVPVELSGRDRTENASPRREAAWSSLARGVLYRLPIDGRNVQQNELELPGWAVRELRLQMDQRGTGLGPEVPSLSVGLPASELVFLVRGSPPYRLAFGKPGAQSAALPLGVLIPGYTESKRATLGSASLGEPLEVAMAVAAPAPGSDWKKIGLWAVLLLGVALLVIMAMSLLRSSPNKP
ncbi:DUF3999 domain-containing protein [Pseudomonas aeruginosa]|uniref:DUF3999 domain-containing protein n=1 Tax=Pseudomonas aeruginosa TaxID=287 RepID=UPI000F828D4B|nr:DUF3999 domain-containing protein [Pseudomonas aeruginosa]RTX38717.1 DUF3999 domain-containing protein [Pseudomonas aeruginosa]